MCSSFRSLYFLAVLVSSSLTVAAQERLRVCADPQNPPFSTRAASGFENQIAKAIAAELREPVEFHWQRLGRGFLREVMNKGACDTLISVPVGMRGLLVTAPYYRSTYVFVTRRNEAAISSLDDPKLASMKIGVQILDEDYAPPAQALARRRLAKNIVGFSMDENAGAIVKAVAVRDIDAAIVWGPLAGYYAKSFGNTLRLTAVEPQVDPPRLPFTFELAVGVRQNEPELYDRVKEAVTRARPRIDSILRDFNVPTLPLRSASTRRITR